MNSFKEKPDIEKYSNPQVVQSIAKKKYNIDIMFSPKVTKKYRFVNPETNKYVDFGQMGYEDYTKHKDKERLKKFKTRNAKWYKAEKYSPAWASAKLLW